MCFRDTTREAASRSGLGSLLAVAALAAALLLAPSAAASHHQLRFGVVENVVEPGSELPLMGRANVATLRVVFNWSVIERSRADRGSCNAAYDWGYSDRLVSEAGRHGVRLLPVIIGSPGYVAGAVTNAPSTRSPAIADYKCFVGSLVRRYGRGGTFPVANGPARPIRDWQVWNEPSIHAYAPNRQVDPREYGRLVKITHRVLTGADRQAGVVLAGVPERFSRGMNGRPFLRRLHKVKRIERSYDVAALHPYARDHRGVLGGVRRLRGLLRGLGVGDRPIWVTEVGWATDGPKGHFAVRSEKGQAKQLAKAFRTLRRNSKRLKVGTVTWYSWRDGADPGDRGAYWHQYAGLYRRDGRPKPACFRFARLTGGRRCLAIAGAAAASASPASSSRLEPRPAVRGVRSSRPG